MFQLHFTDAPEGITAQLVEAHRRGVKQNQKKNAEKSPSFNVTELTSLLLLESVVS